MALFDFFARFSPRKRRAEKAREELKTNAEKALRMKQENATATNIPPHQIVPGWPGSAALTHIEGEGHAREGRQIEPRAYVVELGREEVPGAHGEPETRFHRHA